MAVDRELRLDRRVEDLFFLAFRMVEHAAILLGTRSQMQQQRGVTTVIENHVRVAAIGPFEDLVSEGPVLGQGFALEGEHRRAGLRNRCGSMVLSGEDVA